MNADGRRSDASSASAAISFVQITKTNRQDAKGAKKKVPRWLEVRTQSEMVVDPAKAGIQAWFGMSPSISDEKPE
jgi:hypothetical protein